jgi:putative phosphoribosyl transferase
MNPPFPDRRGAGRLLAEKLESVALGEWMVLALPRGGVPVGFEIALKLKSPLDVFTVRKLGLPGHPEFAMGAIATGGIRVVNEDVVRILRVPPDVIDAVADEEETELRRRESCYRAGSSALDLRGRNVILVDDGLATGATMLATVEAARVAGAGSVVVAAPVASRDAEEKVRAVANDAVFLIVPKYFESVGTFYWDFTQVSDEEVRALLTVANERALKKLTEKAYEHAA